jgi:hypothetical protein
VRRRVSDPGSWRSHAYLALTITLFAVAPPVLAFTTTVPTGSSLVAIGGHPEPRTDPHPLIEHFPLGNLLNFELDFVNQGSPVTFTEGHVQYLDETGTPLLAEQIFNVTRFEEVAVRIGSPQGTAGVVEMGERIILLFPFEELPHNVVPATVDVELFFQEFPGDPLAFRDIELTEYHPPPGQTYTYPTKDPAVGHWFSGNSHELGTPGGAAHRRGGLRRNGQTVWVNQGYAYDIDVHKSGASCDDGNGGSGLSCTQGSDYFCWGEPIHAIADGTVVLLIQGNPDNLEPLCALRQDCSMCTSYDGGPNMDQPVPPLCPFAAGAGGCNNQPDEGLCGATTDPCPPSSGLFPGSGNQVVLQHPNGEFSTYAHMMEGSNDHLMCGQSVPQGPRIGNIGMTGTGSNPHHHFSTLSTPGPEAQVAENFPIYFNNVVFETPVFFTPRRQLDVSLPSGTDILDILPPPAPIPPNAPLPPGPVAEVEPNDTLAAHNALSLPTTVSGTAEYAQVGDLAVRGDGMEDVYRVDLAAADALRLDLVTLTSGANLDLYVLDENLRVMNETKQGTAQSGPERVCLELEPGAYYPLVTNVDLPPSADAEYTLSVQSDPQTIACTLSDPGPLAVDASCEAAVEFTIAIHDNCCLSPDTLNLQVTATNPTDNATLAPVVLDPPTVLSPTDVSVNGTVPVSDLTSCPATVRIEASAEDCSGHAASTVTAATGCEVDVIDTLPPVVTSTVSTDVLWPPNHALVDVGLETVVTDGCDADVADSLVTSVTSSREARRAGFPQTTRRPRALGLEGHAHTLSECRTWMSEPWRRCSVTKGRGPARSRRRCRPSGSGPKARPWRRMPCASGATQRAASTRA